MAAYTFQRLAGADADKAEFSMPAPSKNGDSYRGVRGVLVAVSTYTTGGDLIPMASVGLNEIREILVDPVGVGGGADAFLPGLCYKLGGTPSAPTLRAFVAATGGAGAQAEVAGGTNLGGKAVACYLLGH